MSDTIQNIPLTANVYIDLYAESGISVGSQIAVENIGVSDIYLAVLATQPPRNHDAYNISSRNDALPLENNVGDSGAWAMSPNIAGKVNVRLVI